MLLLLLVLVVVESVELTKKQALNSWSDSSFIFYQTGPIVNPDFPIVVCTVEMHWIFLVDWDFQCFLFVLGAYLGR